MAVLYAYCTVLYVRHYTVQWREGVYVSKGNPALLYLINWRYWCLTWSHCAIHKGALYSAPTVNSWGRFSWEKWQNRLFCEFLVVAYSWVNTVILKPTSNNEMGMGNWNPVHVHVHFHFMFVFMHFQLFPPLNATSKNPQNTVGVTLTGFAILCQCYQTRRILSLWSRWNWFYSPQLMCPFECQKYFLSTR
jgi:hypothetical protein